MTSEASQAVNKMVWILSAIVSACIGAYWMHQSHIKRTPIRFYPQSVGDATSAQRGDIGSVTLNRELLRKECRILPYRNELILEDKAGHHKINQRSHIPGALDLGRSSLVIRFEVPRLAQPGGARLKVFGALACRSVGGEVIISYQSLPMPFEIIGDDDNE